MNALFILLSRILSGERLRKATPEELRLWSAAFFLTPVMLFLVCYAGIGTGFYDISGPAGFWFGVRLWLFMVCGISCFIIGVKFWAKFVPATISWMLSAVGWVLILFMVFTNKL